MEYSNNYIIVFILILTAAVAVGLTGLREATKSTSDLNEEIFEKRAILSAVEDYLPNNQTVSDLSDQQVLDIFEESVEQRALNMDGVVLDEVQAEDIDMAKERKKPEPDRRLPLYMYEHNGETYYIVSVRGNGLWDEIWGNIAFQSDLNTVAGAAFDHKGETPGLGAEIKDNPAFAAQFKGKEIYNEEGEYVSINVRKGGARDMQHEVDGISGATVTADGVTEMLQRGISYYQPYFEELRQSKNMESMLVD